MEWYLLGRCPAYVLMLCLGVFGNRNWSVNAGQYDGVL
jgi:hypothetical protein